MAACQITQRSLTAPSSFSYLELPLRNIRNILLTETDCSVNIHVAPGVILEPRYPNIPVREGRGHEMESSQAVWNVPAGDLFSQEVCV